MLAYLLPNTCSQQQLGQQGGSCGGELHGALRGIGRRQAQGDASTQTEAAALHVRTHGGQCSWTTS